MESDRIVGAVIQLGGIVQGVGFRPFVYRQARRFSLTGSVMNTDTGLVITVDGERPDIERFFREVRRNPPPLAEIHASAIRFTKPGGFTGFSIAASPEGREGFTPVSPDIATCGDCLEDIFRSGDRRERYAFTNCTNCGPRFSIIRTVPYDRANTTMSVFPMCGPCAAEYRDPLDRRYHAQPNACPACGPSLSLLAGDGSAMAGDPLEETLDLIRRGKIVAIKGIGGYHLAADPFNREAVRTLRERKRRPGKPFALMARDLGTARRYCRMSAVEERVLVSSERPILLLERTEEAALLAPDLAPDTNLLGVMLPYTPLHHLLMETGRGGSDRGRSGHGGDVPARKSPELLVMTSGNLSEEPLAYEDGDALAALGAIADAFLVHDRGIQRPCDDSVLMGADPMPPVPIRRSRGYVPRGIDVGYGRTHLLAAGAMEKNTFCVFRDSKAYPSHHVGDLANEKSVDAYSRGVDDFLALFRVEPEAIACDLHPDYESTRFARSLAARLGVPLVRVQHHHAHIASLLGEAGLRERVIGVAFDGTGYGTDGTIWGGEFLLADTGGFERAAHLAEVPMPGGERAILETDRMAVSHLLAAFGTLDSVPRFGFQDRVGDARLRALESVIGSGINCHPTSSCGRLFDAVASITGLCDRPSYDAQGAILLQSAAAGMERLEETYPFEVRDGGVVDAAAAVRRIVHDLAAGASAQTVSRRFHSTVVAMCVEVCGRLREASGIGTVALSGGVFQNGILLAHLRRRLEEERFSVLVHRLVPPNDGGVSLGQGIFTLCNMERGKI